MGTISLTKGQKIDLTKGNPGLTKIMVGLGWDEAPEKKGFLGFGGSTADIDCDASVLMLEAGERLSGINRVVYYGNLTSTCGSVAHSGDNLTGGGDGDDEQIHVDLARVPQVVQKLLFVVNIYKCQERKQDFGMIQNAFIRVVDPAGRRELCRFNLTDDYKGKTALVVAEVYRHDREWKFAALGQATTDGSLSELFHRYQ